MFLKIGSGYYNIFPIRNKFLVVLNQFFKRHTQ